MLISELHINNFRSFGYKSQMIETTNLTALIGANSSGKTSLIMALLRLFGQKNTDRTLVKTDFHIPESADISKIKEIDLMIEAKITFPELMSQSPADVKTVPEYIKHLIIEETGADPYLRIRLKGKWVQGSTPEGNIEQELVYVKVPYGHEEKEEDLTRVQIHHQKLIQMMYIPAMRDPAKQLKNASGTLLWRIFDGIDWPKDLNDDIKSLTTPIETLFKEIPSIKEMQGILNTQWNKYHKDKRYSNSQFKFNGNSLEEFLKNAEILFNPTVDGNSVKIDSLGDGLKSLFYITLVSTLLEIENKQEKDDKPLLNILAIEEPENHISQHLLGRIVRNLKEISNKDNAQVILSSHNSSIIGKIDPEYIRHLQIKNSESIVNNITLPEKADDAHTYIKEAVKAYPDLYFSKLVILGEGDSEEIVLPKLLSADNIYLDDFNISVVPLGGRYVNHMWKLLNDLSIPYVTLLDLDRERGGGDWGRIKYVLKQLDENNRCSEQLRTVVLTPSNKTRIYSMEDIEDFHKRESDRLKSLDTWIKKLEKEDVFFSYPLDLDFSMLKSFQQEYQNTMTRGPRIPQDVDLPEYDEKLQTSIQATLKNKKAIAKTYSGEEKELMIWYNSLFLGRGKPGTHIAALKDIGDTEILKHAPEELLRLVKRVKEKVGLVGDNTDE
ncbi:MULTISPECIES: ATP-dependent nuclease [Bacillus]|uniref:ATP-dependent nuclease n=1 Tax=Bacillus TaxID=1386 RepID=UPI0009774D22|nr:MULTISPECIES: AAA family ATPase [unclassified Bacillus cereus group]ONG66684.1 ATP-dependent endonuclease [Bacillus cereus]MDA2760996.1 AAA family ATPase [Bacillus cereus group sp. Bc007]MDA2766656.1 AAA family ATPase [Bacillus cereus group sp. Bc008]MDA2777802.1 AAA family ATPase [Bacillus cereus group sp. Bc005]ONG78305.1 ATP-dependent endonuclease [Bacillus cereus]